MNIRVNGRAIDKWSNLSMTLIYASVKSIFSFDIFWEPYNPDTFWRSLALPGACNICTIVADNGEVMLTGVMNSCSFKSGANKYLVNITGCSITGVMDDISYAALVKETSSEGLTIFQVACKAANKLGIYVIDNSGGDGSVPISKSTVKDTDNIAEKCTDYISSLCRDNDIVLTHDEYGNLLLSKPDTTKAAIFNFADGMPGIEIDLMFDGTRMHSTLIGQSTADTTNDNPQEVSVTNPYVTSNSGFNYLNAARNNATLNSNMQSAIINKPNIGGLSSSPQVTMINTATQLQVLSEYNTAVRPIIHKQNNTDPSNMRTFISQKLSDELGEGIQVNVQMQGWELKNKVPRPGMTVTIHSPENFLFQPTKFFIDSIDFAGDERTSTLTLNCVVPEVYNSETPINIFTSNGNNTNFKDAPAPDPGSTLVDGFAGQNKFIDL